MTFPFYWSGWPAKQPTTSDLLCQECIGKSGSYSMYYSPGKCPMCGRKIIVILEGGEDDPIYDGTDAAHPAWWRAHDHTSQVFASKITDWLDGKDDGHGVMNQPWQTIRERIRKLVKDEPKYYPTPECAHPGCKERCLPNIPYCTEHWKEILEENERHNK